MKNFLLCIVVVAMAIMVGVKANSTESMENEYLLMNVEALATPEEDVAAYCRGVGCNTCPITGTKVKYVIELSR